jgi:CRP-like cAMP-binding protein
MTKLREFITNIIELTDADWFSISQIIITKKYKKQEVIHSIGDVCRKIMFIRDGVARSYIIKENGKDFTWQFHFSDKKANLKNLFLVDYASLTSQKASLFGFEAIEDCELLVISYDEIQKLYDTDCKWQYFGRIVAEEAYRLTQERTVSLLTLDAHERLDALRGECPDVFDKIPHYYIASFLGITPQSLSRLRHS